MQPFIVQGDKTSHGGTVLAGSPFSDCSGKPIARVGDMVACPKCKGVFPIAEGDKSNIVDGAPVAYHGCKTACGAMLISSQMVTLTNPSSGSACGTGDSDSEEGAQPGYSAIGHGLAAAYQDEQVRTDQARFQGRFQVVDLDDGSPISGQAVRILTSDGKELAGVTDAEGYTQWVERDAAEALAFYFDERTA